MLFDGLSDCLAECAATGFDGSTAPVLTATRQCVNIQTEAECVVAADDRAQYAENPACHWCCGDACLSDNGNKCQPEGLLLETVERSLTNVNAARYVGHSRNGLGYNTCESHEGPAVTWTSLNEVPSCAMGCLLYSRMIQTHPLEPHSWSPMCHRQCQAADDAGCDYALPGYQLSMCGACGDPATCPAAGDCDKGCEYHDRLQYSSPRFGSIISASSLTPDQWVFLDTFDDGPGNWTSNNEAWFLATCVDKGGIPNNGTCCAGSCGQCGGADCGAAPGGTDNCCVGPVTSNTNPNNLCTRNGGQPVCHFLQEDMLYYLTQATALGSTVSNSILGGHGTAGRGVYFERTYDLSTMPHTSIRIELDFYVINAWDGEKAGPVYVDGVSIWEEDNVQEVPHSVNSGGQNGRVIQVDAQVAHTVGSAVIRVTSGLDEAASNEAFGVDNIRMTASDASGTGSLVVGTPIYVDESTPTVASVATRLSGLEFLKSASADIASEPAAADWLCLDASSESVLYVLYDSRVAQLDVPGWLISHFELQGLSVETSDDAIVFDVWSMHVHEARRICLGGNAATGAAANFIVAIGPAGPVTEGVSSICSCATSPAGMNATSSTQLTDDIDSWWVEVTYPNGVVLSPYADLPAFAVYPPNPHECSTPTVRSSSSPDSAGLVTLYHSLGDSVYTQLVEKYTRAEGKWQPHRDPCTGWTGSLGWHGVTCEQEFSATYGSVVAIRLRRRRLTGSLALLGGFKALRVLDLGENQFTGNLAMLQNLTALTELRLERNELSGKLGGFEQMRGLQVIDLQWNPSITGTLEAVAGLPALQSLRLSFNGHVDCSLNLLVGLPALRRLSLSTVGATGTLEPLARLPVLEYVDLRDNNITGSMAALGSMKAIRQLLLDGNEMESLPANNILSVPTEVCGRGADSCTASVGRGYITRCAENSRVSAYRCVACGPGKTNEAGDDMDGDDTFCEAVLCRADHYVDDHHCLACPPGATQDPGQDSSGGNTQCATDLCLVDEFVQSNACVACAPGTISGEGNDPTGADTVCAAVLCGMDESVHNHACQACAAGRTNSAGGDDASGPNTGSCSATFCGADEYNGGHTCVVCAPGTTNPAGDDTSGDDTTCTATICGEDEHVDGNTCVACASEHRRAGGDDASGNDTACEVTAGDDTGGGSSGGDGGGGGDPGGGTAPACGADNECATGEICNDGFCAADSGAGGTGGGTAPGGTACQADADCAAEEVCDQGSCVSVAPADADCVGSWSACTAACEVAAGRAWTETTAQSGGAAACPAALNCTDGEDACVGPMRDGYQFTQRNNTYLDALAFRSSATSIENSDASLGSCAFDSNWQDDHWELSACGGYDSRVTAEPICRLVCGQVPGCIAFEVRNQGNQCYTVGSLMACSSDTDCGTGKECWEGICSKSQNNKLIGLMA